MNTKLDIAKILTLSTAHIKPETATMLDNEPNTFAIIAASDEKSATHLQICL